MSLLSSLPTRLASCVLSCAFFAFQVEAADQSPANAPEIWKDASRPLDERINDLISRMTLQEKVQQLRNDTPSIPRLGIPSYNYWNEGLHGVARNGIATVFPQA